MKLNKLGTFSMSQLGQSKSIISDFIKSAREKNDNFEEGLLKLVRTLPKVLKFLPSDKAKDARNFVNSLQYWLGGNQENLENLLINIAQVRLHLIDIHTSPPHFFWPFSLLSSDHISLSLSSPQ